MKTYAILALALGAAVGCTSAPAGPSTGTPGDIAAVDAILLQDGDPGATADVAKADTPKLPPKKRNFLVFVGEAIGWTGTSVQLDPDVPSPNAAAFLTPNLDQLAKGGARFSHFYAASPRCMPTRAALFAGQSPAQLHMTFIPGDGNATSSSKVIPPNTVTDLPTATPTVASYLKAGGYATAHFGKWHAGNTPPEQYGFDASDGPTSNGGPEKVKYANPKEVFGMTDRALAFIDTAVKGGKPFYVQVSNYNSREQAESLPESWAKAQAANPGMTNVKHIGLIAGGIDFDTNMGKLLTKLHDLGVDQDTYVIYTSDHGGQDPWSNAPLAESKGTVWEGGIRVPLLVAGPGIPGGIQSAVKATTVDLFPTIAALSGVGLPLPAKLEGGDLSGVLLGDGAGEVKRPYLPLVQHFPHYDFDPLGPASAIILGDFKLIRFYESGTRKLFDLKHDIGETQDLSVALAQTADQLDAALTEYLKAVGAQMPTVP